ncbi:extracellular solute-binding protein [Oribacterium sp. KHPX15]|uniref:extracellular solute-binding protein n=1 Tax=Oribacterium sp. KHPX15 TaxID=1855342 RepID=UPI000B85EBBB|nr:extracellular solute-binding protein [Oribacterium sp. KHPX15]
MVKRRYRLLLSGVLVLLAILTVHGFLPVTTGEEKVLTVGAFAGSYWSLQNGNSYKILDDAIDLFEKENPGVKVQYVSGITLGQYQEWLSEKKAEGRMPDVFLVPSDIFQSFADIGVMQNLDGFIKHDIGFSLDLFYEKTLKGGRYRNIQYALPFECSPVLMIMNKTLLRDNSIPVPDENWTWDEFYEACEMTGISDTNAGGQYGVIDYGWQDAFAANKVKLFNDKGTACDFTGDDIYESLLFLERLTKLPKGKVTSASDFYKGVVAFEPMSFATYRASVQNDLSYQNYSDFEWGYTSMPAGMNGDNVSRLDTLTVAMSSDSHYKKEAWQFMKTLTSEEAVQKEIYDYSEGLSPLKSVTEDPELAEYVFDHYGVVLNRDVITYVMERAENENRFPDYEEIATEVTTAVDSILEDKSNIRMEQIIWNRRINNYIKKLS